jgi:hypothetical protein
MKLSEIPCKLGLHSWTSIIGGTKVTIEGKEYRLSGEYCMKCGIYKTPSLAIPEDDADEKIIIFEKKGWWIGPLPLRRVDFDNKIWSIEGYQNLKNLR